MLGAPPGAGNWGPRVNRPHFPVTEKGGGGLTGEISPSARSTTVRPPPLHSTLRGEPNGPTKATKGVRGRAHRCQWRSSGAAQRRPAISGQEAAQGGELKHRGSKANEIRAWRREKGERRGGVC
jgi:hypothetical protein